MAHSQFQAWDQDDQDKALAYLAWRAETCRECGTRLEEWDPKQGGEPDAYVAQTERCFGCQHIAKTARNFEKQGGDMAGLRVYLVPNTGGQGPEDDEPIGTFN